MILRCLSCGRLSCLALTLRIGVDPARWRTLHPLAEPVVTLDRDVLIGRDVGAEHIRVDDLSVSRHHAEIMWVGNAWMVRDLQSTNGTRVNGAPLEGVEARRLGHGDQIQIGSWTLLTVGEMLRYVETG